MIGSTNGAFSALEDRLERLDALGEEEMEELKEGFSDLLDDEEQDLRAYRQAVREQRREDRSLADRLKEAVQGVFGITAQQHYEKRLEQAQEVLQRYERVCDALEEELSSQTARLSEVASQHVAARGLFETCKQQYGKRQERVDRLEVRVEESEREHGQRLSLDVYELRQQLTDARRELHALRIEGNEARLQYRQTKDTYAALEELTTRLSTHVVRLREQSSAFRIRLSAWKSDKLLTFGGPDQSARELYAELAVFNQDMQRFREERLGSSADEPLDKAYAIGRKDTEPDETEQEWLRMTAS